MVDKISQTFYRSKWKRKIANQKLQSCMTPRPTLFTAKLRWSKRFSVKLFCMANHGRNSKDPKGNFISLFQFLHLIDKQCISENTEIWIPQTFPTPKAQVKAKAGKEKSAHVTWTWSRFSKTTVSPICSTFLSSQDFEEKL